MSYENPTQLYSQSQFAQGKLDPELSTYDAQR
ncbi:Uncharacterised protein [Corynebacterium diphtheriae]|nr:Uncharacterised protein [Corynebacterium diphtheriae]